MRIKEFINAVKIAFLFVGTIIGAGFATGRELALFFGKNNLLTIIVSAALMGIFCYIFLLCGKKCLNLSPSISKIIDKILAISAFFLYSAMLAAAEELILCNFNIPLAGLFLGIISAVFASTIERLKILNFLLIPFLIAVVIIISISAKASPFGTNFNILNATGYCAMNMLFAAKIIQESGKNMKNKDIFTSSIIVSVVMFVLMFLMIKVIIKYREFSMPFLLVAIESNKLLIGIIAILIAIITTMASCNKIVVDELNYKIKNPLISYFSTLSMGLAVSIFGFAPLVNYTYPVISILGIAICIYTLIRVFTSSYSKNNIAKLQKH